MDKCREVDDRREQTRLREARAKSEAHEAQKPESRNSAQGHTSAGDVVRRMEIRHASMNKNGAKEFEVSDEEMETEDPYADDTFQTNEISDAAEQRHAEYTEEEFEEEDQYDSGGFSSS